MHLLYAKIHKHLIPGVLHKGAPFSNSWRILLLFESKTFIVFKDCLLQSIFFFVVKYVEYKFTYWLIFLRKWGKVAGAGWKWYYCYQLDQALLLLFHYYKKWWVHYGRCLGEKGFMIMQASTLTQNHTGPVGPVTPSICWSCKLFTGPTFFL